MLITISDGTSDILVEIADIYYSSMNGYVPYLGALNDVNLGVFNLTTVGSIISNNLSGFNTGDQESSDFDHNLLTNYNINEHFLMEDIFITESQITDLDKYTQSEVGSLFQTRNEKSKASGYASLDLTGKVPVRELPYNAVLNIKGFWHASTNTPFLTDGVGTSGDTYIVKVAGTVDFGHGNITFNVGDWVIYIQSLWQQNINTANVISVNEQTGVVQLDTDDIDEGINNLYYTNTRVTSFLGSMLVSSSGGSIDNTIPKYHLTTGKIIQNTGVTINDSNSISIPNNSSYLYDGVNALRLIKADPDEEYANYVSTFVGENAGNINNLSTTAVGQNSGKAGFGHSAFGHAAGYLTTGTNRVDIGILSGYTGTGNGVITLGAFAGYNMHGSGNVAIGYYAGQTYTGNNLFIVQSKYPSALNTDPLILGDFNTGDIEFKGNVYSKGILLGNGSGDVSSLGLSSDNAIARFDGITGKNIQTSGVTIDDLGNMNISSIGSYCQNGYSLARYTNLTSISFGTDAGSNNTGTHHIAMGYLAGANNVGYGNINIGRFSGITNTANTVNNQVSIGLNAGSDNTGTSQICIGAFAGANNTGPYQIAIGGFAGHRNTASSQTTLGVYAGYNNTGDTQIALGEEAGVDNTGDYQTALGPGAGAYNSGFNNISIGRTAGLNNSGSECIFLGCNSGHNNTDDYIFEVAGSNTTVIRAHFNTGIVEIPHIQLNNILITATGSEINYLTGLGSNVQDAFDERIIGSGVNRIFLASAEPGSPSIGDVWIDTNI